MGGAGPYQCDNAAQLNEAIAFLQSVKELKNKK
jgi:hypothetical protein